MSDDEKVERWEPPTMKSVMQIEGNPIVKCGCGRKANADMMRVLREGYGCDSCMETGFRQNDITREAFAQDNGAPPEVIAKAQYLDALQMDRQLDVARRSTPKA